MTMKLQEVRIRRSYSNDELTGQISFKTNNGVVELELTDEDCRPILEHCAAAVVISSKRVAESLTSEAIAVTAIEHQPEETDE